VTSWTGDELARIGPADELELAARLIGVERSGSVAEKARVAVTKPQALHRGLSRTVTFHLQNVHFFE